MKHRQYALSLVIMIILAAGARADEIRDKEPPADKEARHAWSTGVLGGITMAGIQGEYRPIPELGIRVCGISIFGADFNLMNKDEYILSGLLAPVLHIAPDSSLLDPMLMFGAVYSYHHWETKNIELLDAGSSRTLRKGTIHDVTFGMGFGLNFRFAGRWKAGFDLWLNYDYEVKNMPSLKKTKGRRIILPLPLVECTVEF
jgi:hypothetical protein